MKIEIVRKVDDKTTIIINELCNDATFDAKLEKLKDSIKEIEESFS